MNSYVRPVAVALALLCGSAALGQAVNYPPGAIVQSLEPGPGDDLARHLAELNSSPRSVTALLGAGNAALALGDYQGALSFFARAEEVAPRDGRVKAGMGSAFVHSENPQAAFRFFAEAQGLGIPLRSFAKDRGLAYDMIGDPVRAQADYAVALQAGSDPEVERRMALSRAINGDKQGAIAILDPQLRRQDRAGWRTQAFVLALTGDAAGAANVAQSMMPGPRSAAMRPFFEKLPSLSSTDKAMAVHFGRFPQGDRSFAVASAATASTEASRAPTAGQYGPRYRGTAGTSTRSAPTRVTPQPSPSTPPSTPSPAPQNSLPGLAQSSPSPAQPTSPPTVQHPPSAPATTFTSRVAKSRTSAAAPSVAAPARAPAPPRQVQSASTQVMRPPADANAEAGNRLAFADVASAVRALPEAKVTSATAVAPAPSAPKIAASAPRPATAPPKVAPAKATAGDKAAKDKGSESKQVVKKTEPKKVAAPARIWVQLAAGQNVEVFPSEFKKMQSKAPKLLSGKTAWTAPLGNTNRLVVGPFKTDREARDLVNELAKLKVGSYPWKSSDGEVVEKLSAK